MVEPYLELTQGGDLVKQMRAKLEQAYDAPGMPAEQRDWLVESMGDLLAEAMALTIEQLRATTSSTASRSGELEADKAFYESPTSRSVVRKQVDMNMELQQVMTPLIIARMESCWTNSAFGSTAALRARRRPNRSADRRPEIFRERTA